MCAPLRNFEVLIVIIKKLDNGRKETINHLVIYALQEGNSEGGGGGGSGERGNSYTRRLPPERGAIFRLQVLGVGISLLEVYEQYMKLRGKSVNFVCKKAQNG